MATAYEIRTHLRQSHAVNMIGADYGTLLRVHDLEHKPGMVQDHDHPEWDAECIDFGCDDAP